MNNVYRDSLFLPGNPGGGFGGRERYRVRRYARTNGGVQPVELAVAVAPTAEAHMILTAEEITEVGLWPVEFCRSFVTLNKKKRISYVADRSFSQVRAFYVADSFRVEVLLSGMPSYIAPGTFINVDIDFSVSSS